MKVYAFLHNSLTVESTDQTISLHRTKAGAYKAMRKHRVAECEQHREFRFDFPYDSYKWWGIKEMEVLD